MLSVLVRDVRGIEIVHGDIRDVAYVPPSTLQSTKSQDGDLEPGVHVRFLRGDGIHVPYRGIASAGDHPGAGVFVMNELGKTVAKYSV